ncbi:MAG: hypothetical protein M1834_000452 [Cirrosporium novae-zelandiae]|nr:MAG: hypothetical protein M1834_000452 [Cirrosporium novae-zelandiae]
MGSSEIDVTAALPTNGSKKPIICVFCGASAGTSSKHIEAARSLAHAFHKYDISLVYGGGTVGIMGELARTVVSLSGSEAVHGIIPEALIKFEQKPGEEKDDLTKIVDEKIYGRTTVVPDMHTRKQLMARMVMAGGEGSGFIALSGGYGTLEELAEVTTWNQLGIHHRGVVVLNIDGYWDGLLQWISKAVDSGFISSGNSEIIVEAKTPEEAVKALQDYQVAEGRFVLDWKQG